ncbi:MAG: glutaredoxin [Pseudohongiellaceae bacterium]
MVFRLFRRLTGLVVNFYGRLTRPRQIQRSVEEKALLNREARGLSLYDYKGCSAGVKIRNTIHGLNIDIEIRDIRKCPVHMDNLLSCHGRVQVPCLKIEENGKVQWLDQPEEIIQYLTQRFDTRSAQYQFSK